MKILYIESKLKNNKLELSGEEINKLPKKIFLAYTIQYKESAENIKKLVMKSLILSLVSEPVRS